MFNNITPETAQHITTGIQGYLTTSAVDKILGNPQNTSRNASLFGFHPAAPDHVRDLAYEIEIIRQKRENAINNLTYIPPHNPYKTTLNLKKRSKPITNENVHLIVEAIKSGAQFIQIDRALDLNTVRGIRHIAKEGTHPNADTALKLITAAVKERDSKKHSTKKLLETVNAKP